MTQFMKLLLVGTITGMVMTTAAIETAAAAEPENRITILYDAFGKDASMRKDWGFSALVEIAGKRILFDTGDDRDIFAANVKAKNVDLTKLDFAFWHQPPLCEVFRSPRFFVTDRASLAVLREKDGKLRIVHAGWDDANVVQPDGYGQARGGGRRIYPPPSGK